MNTNKYYVYAHIFDDVVFYIGKGCGSRATSKSYRNKTWHNIVDFYGYNNITIDIIHSDLDEATAEILEKQEIVSHNPRYILCNEQLNHSKKSIDMELLLSKLQYDQDSPSGLVRITSAGNQKAGSVAGTLTPKGYWAVRLGHQKTMYAHRLVWALHYGDIPDNLTIDHIDGNRSNNTIGNLRICTMEENNQYREERAPLRVSNSSGIPGITEHNNGSSSLYARVQYTLSGERYRKDFSYSKYGKEGAWEEAIKFKEGLLKNH